MSVVGQLRAGSSSHEASAVRLIYSMRRQPEKERNIILVSVRPHLLTALCRVVSIVEKTLQAKGIFKHSMSLLGEHEALADLLVQRTDISSLWEYLLEFQKTTIDEIADSLTIRFYNQLVALLDGGLTTPPELPTDPQPTRTELPLIDDARKERAEEQAVLGALEGREEVEIVEESCVAGKQLSALSAEFLESFKGGSASGQEAKGKTVRRRKVGCLQPGEPMQKWQYYDSLDGGIVKVVFTSRK